MEDEKLYPFMIHITAEQKAWLTTQAGKKDSLSRAEVVRDLIEWDITNNDPTWFDAIGRDDSRVDMFAKTCEVLAAAHLVFTDDLEQLASSTDPDEEWIADRIEEAESRGAHCQCGGNVAGGHIECWVGPSCTKDQFVREFATSAMQMVGIVIPVPANVGDDLADFWRGQMAAAVTLFTMSNIPESLCAPTP
jgi:hypothetical protein